MLVKNIAMTVLSALSIFTATMHSAPSDIETPYEVANRCEYVNSNYCDSSLTKGLQANQTTIFYMYSNGTGHYFIDALAEFENIIYVGLSDFNIDVNTLHHGKRFVGTFADNSLWELIDIQESINKELK